MLKKISFVLWSHTKAGSPMHSKHAEGLALPEGACPEPAAARAKVPKAEISITAALAISN